MFPFLVGHVNTLKFAVDHALSAIDAAIHVVFHYVPLSSAVQDDELDRIRRAILHAKAAACAGRGCIG